MKKLFYIILIIVIIAGGYYFYDKANKQVKAPNTTQEIEQSSNNQQQTLDNNSITPTPTPSQAVKKQAETTTVEGTFSAGEDTGGQATDVQVYEINYDGTKFTPSRIEIKVNDYVFFKNVGNVDFWPASASHPDHSDYPEFDAKKALGPGKTFKFQFTKAGNWGFHDHLNSEAIGLVEVK